MAAASWPCPMAETRVSDLDTVGSVVDTVTQGGETECVAVICGGGGAGKTGPTPCPPIYSVTASSRVRLEMILQALGEFRFFRPIGLAAAKGYSAGCSSPRPPSR